jgi:hypothetical protein
MGLRNRRRRWKGDQVDEERYVSYVVGQGEVDEIVQG